MGSGIKIPRTTRMAPARSRHIIPMFLIVLALAFISQTWPYWRSGRLLPGTHADGAFHYYSELARLSPSLFPNDLAVTSNRNLGYYEHFYRGLGWIARATGLGLLNTNMLVCWLGNALYLLGVMRVLDRLGLPPLWCAVGTLLAAQVYVLLAMWSGVVHSVAIPREFWLWPLPWFLAWFLGGARSGPELLLFYGALGLTYAMTYPLWAALFGLAFGLGDLWRLAQAPSAAGFLWLGLAGGVCLLLVALPSLTMLHVVSRDGSAIADYNQVGRSVYASKGFRRLLLFTALGAGALFLLQRSPGGLSLPAARLAAVTAAAVGVCCLYEPLQRLLPSVSLLYPGRLSLLAYLGAMGLVTTALAGGWPHWGPGARITACVGMAALCLAPQPSLRKEARDTNLPASPEFVAFAEGVRERTPVESLGVMPPEVGSHYFRVFAERGLWIDPKDLGILSRERATYDLAQKRLTRLRAFYAPEATPADRSQLLEQMAAEGVGFVVTRATTPWGSSLPWPVTWESGGWRLHLRRNP